MLRDFSEKSKQQLLTMVTDVENEKLCDFTDWVGDRWLDFQSWIGKLNIKNYLNNVNAYHKKVIDQNNTTKTTIEKIFNSVNIVDNKTSLKLQTIEAQLILFDKSILELGDIANPVNGKFTDEYISFSMNNKIKEYIDSNMAQYNDTLKHELIKFDATSLFIDSRNKFTDAIAIGWSSDWIKNVLSLFQFGNFQLSENANEVAVRKSIEQLLRELLINKHTAQDTFQNCVDTFSPESNEVGKKIIDNFLKTGKIYTEAEIAKVLKIDFSKYKQSDICKLLEQGILKEDNLKFLKNLSDTVDNTLGAYKDGVQIFEISTNIISRVYNDYTEDIKYLEAIKQSLIAGGYNNKTVNKVVDKMLNEYQNKYLAVANYGAEQICNKAIDKGIDIAMPLLNVFLDTKDISSTIIGLKDSSDNIANVYATQQYSYSVLDKYEYYRKKINSGQYGSYDIEQCKLYFEMAKSSKLQEFRAIKNVLNKALNGINGVFANSEDKQYTKDVITKIDSEILSLENMKLNL